VTTNRVRISVAEIPPAGEVPLDAPLSFITADRNTENGKLIF
jgi:hypothetical protein